MSKNYRILILIMCIVFSITFYFGIFANPNFSIYEFCMNLSTEIIGIVITVVLVDQIIKRKTDIKK